MDRRTISSKENIKESSSYDEKLAKLCVSLFGFMMFLIVKNSRDSVNFSSLNAYYTAGSSLVINCTITAYQLSPVITTEVTSYLKHNNNIIESRIFDVTVNGSYEFSLSASFIEVNLSNAGNYTCSYLLNNNSFVQSSEVKSTTVTLIIKSKKH